VVLNNLTGEIEYPLSNEQKSKAIIYRKRISVKTESVQSIINDMIDYLMGYDDIKNIADKIKENLSNQNKIVYLNDHSLILYSIIETIQRETAYSEFWFIFIVEEMGKTSIFREFFSFLHGCLDFYQFNPYISFIVIMNRVLRDVVLADVFPQLYDRLEEVQQEEAVEDF
jgi:hypothetical protein